jgi:exodeoxyribonuclease-3
VRIVAWNANMAVRRKLPELRSLAPDVAVLSECEQRVAVPEGASFAWVGRNPHKGLGVLAFGPYSVSLDPAFDPRLQWIAPVRVTGPRPFTLLAVWAQNDRAKVFHPLEPRSSQLQQALTVFRNELRGSPAVLAGDFNNNVQWDRGKPADWTVTVDRLGEAGFVSAYHADRAVAYGREPEPTLYWRDRRVDGPTYHIDYCFVPRAWSIVSVAVGSFQDWVGARLSDHVPLTVEVEPDG